MPLRAGRQLHGKSCGRSYWSGSWLQSLAARSAKWPQGSLGTHRPQSVRRSSGPSRSKACGRIQHCSLTPIPSSPFTLKKIRHSPSGSLQLCCCLTVSWLQPPSWRCQSPKSPRSPWSGRYEGGCHLTTEELSGDWGYGGALWAKEQTRKEAFR